MGSFSLFFQAKPKAAELVCFFAAAAGCQWTISLALACPFLLDEDAKAYGSDSASGGSPQV